MCESPFRLGAAEFGCNRCLPCRINRRRLWATRLEFEALVHPVAFFLTLTLSEDYLHGARSEVIESGRDPQRDLSVREAQLFLKRLRDRVSPDRVRYFLCGEYGELFGRPHYHVVLFGSEALRSFEQSHFEAIWQNGGVHLGLAERGSFGYVGGYVTKGHTRAGDPKLGGRSPEFARMSLRPGIGAFGLQAIADWCLTREGAKFIAATGDVPRNIRVGGRAVPLGRYLCARLRSLVGVESPDRLLEYSRDCYLEMIVDGGAARAAKRRQHARVAKVRVQIKNSVRSL